jgi:hypothetical protein
MGHAVELMSDGREFFGATKGKCRALVCARHCVLTPLPRSPAPKPCQMVEKPNPVCPAK